MNDDIYQAMLLRRRTKTLKRAVNDKAAESVFAGIVFGCIVGAMFGTVFIVLAKLKGM